VRGRKRRRWRVAVDGRGGGRVGLRSAPWAAAKEGRQNIWS
jgi:hypothetical protein